MTFGLKHIQGVDKDKLQTTKRQLEEQESDLLEGGSSQSPVRRAPAQSQSATSSSTSQTSAPPRQSRFSRQQPQAQTPNKTTNAVAKNEQPSSLHNSSKAPTGKEQEKPQKPRFSFSGTEAERETSLQSSSQQQKSLRARRLVQEVGDFQKWDQATMEQAERDAMRNPEEAIASYLKIYQNDVKPFKANCVRSLEEARRKHPSDIVFLLIKKDSRRICILPSTDTSSQDVLNGATLESIPASSTQFGKPKDLFDNLNIPPALRSSDHPVDGQDGAGVDAQGVSQPKPR